MYKLPFIKRSDLEVPPLLPQCLITFELKNRNPYKRTVYIRLFRLENTRNTSVVHDNMSRCIHVCVCCYTLEILTPMCTYVHNQIRIEVCDVTAQVSVRSVFYIYGNIPNVTATTEAKNTTVNIYDETDVLR